MNGEQKVDAIALVGFFVVALVVVGLIAWTAPSTPVVAAACGAEAR